MSAPHKHAALIKQWADGAPVQYLADDSSGAEWIDIDRPSWWNESVYRIKPKNLTPLVKHFIVSPINGPDLIAFKCVEIVPGVSIEIGRIIKTDIYVTLEFLE